MLYTIAVIIAIVWLIGLIAHIGGGLIHLLIVVAVILALYQLITGRRPGPGGPSGGGPAA